MSQVVGSDRGVDSPLLNTAEAALYCRVSKRTFERRVHRHLHPVVIGRRKLYYREELDQWLAQQRGSICFKTVARGYIRSGSRTPVTATATPLAKELLARVRAKQTVSTPRSSLVGGKLEDR
jgi:excisionase family DNA binding protein